jgi:hypothetical protein
MTMDPGGAGTRAPERVAPIPAMTTTTTPAAGAGPGTSPAAGLGVGLLPCGHATGPGVRLIPLTAPPVELRAYAVARRGRLSWPPLALVTSLLRNAAQRAP